MEYGLRCAIEIPLKMARLVTDIWPTIVELIEIFHLPTSSDLQVGIQCLRTAVYAAAYNIFINLKMDEAKNLRKEVM